MELPAQTRNGVTCNSSSRKLLSAVNFVDQTRKNLEVSCRQRTRSEFVLKYTLNNIGVVADLNGEENVYFTDHIFLEKHLEPWCPKKGPIRHFMELVCVGLSKNPYLSVERKRDHISWYKEYFKDKKQLLQEVGALPLDSIENLNNV